MLHFIHTAMTCLHFSLSVERIIHMIFVSKPVPCIPTAIFATYQPQLQMPERQQQVARRQETSRGPKLRIFNASIFQWRRESFLSGCSKIARLSFYLYKKCTFEALLGYLGKSLSTAGTDWSSITLLELSCEAMGFYRRSYGVM